MTVEFGLTLVELGSNLIMCYPKLAEPQVMGIVLPRVFGTLRAQIRDRCAPTWSATIKLLPTGHRAQSLGVSHGSTPADIYRMSIWGVVHDRAKVRSTGAIFNACGSDVGPEAECLGRDGSGGLRQAPDDRLHGQSRSQNNGTSSKSEP